MSFIFQQSTQLLDTNSVLTALERSLAMIEFDLQHRILWVNSSFAQIMGYTEAEILGIPLRMIKHASILWCEAAYTSILIIRKYRRHVENSDRYYLMLNNH